MKLSAKMSAVNMENLINKTGDYMIYRLPELKDKDILLKYVQEW